MVNAGESHIKHFQRLGCLHDRLRIRVVGDHHHIAAGAAPLELLHVGRFLRIVCKRMSLRADRCRQLIDQLCTDAQRL